MHSLFLENLETLVAYFAVINLYRQQGHEAKTKELSHSSIKETSLCLYLALTCLSSSFILSIFSISSLFHLYLRESLSPTCLPGWFLPWNILFPALLTFSVVTVPVAVSTFFPSHLSQSVHPLNSSACMVRSFLLNGFAKVARLNLSQQVTEEKKAS